MKNIEGNKVYMEESGALDMLSREIPLTFGYKFIHYLRSQAGTIS